MGELTLPDDTSYRGKFENGLFNGYGVLEFTDGTKYAIYIRCSPNLFCFILSGRSAVVPTVTS